jgi:hypothetical protein
MVTEGNENEEVIETPAVETPEYVVERLDDGGPQGVFEVSVASDDEEVITTPTEEIPTEEPVETPAEPTEEFVPTPETPIEAPVPTEEEIQAPQVTIDADTVKSFLKENYGIEAESLDDLKPKEQKKLDPLAEKLQEFIEKTGNTDINAFLESQRDWSQENESTRLMAYLQIENPDLSQQQLNRLFNKRYSTEGLDPEYEADADAILDKEIALKQDLRKADAVLEQRKQDFMVNRGSEDLLPEDVKGKLSEFDRIAQEQKNYQDAVKRQQETFVAKTNELFTGEFEGFKVTVDGKEYKIKPQDVVATKTKQSDVGNIINKYFDKETGIITDPVGYHKAIFFADNPELAAKHFIEIGRAEEAERAERESKNITEGMKSIPPVNGKPAFVVEKVD